MAKVTEITTTSAAVMDAVKKGMDFVTNNAKACGLRRGFTSAHATTNFRGSQPHQQHARAGVRAGSGRAGCSRRRRGGHSVEAIVGLADFGAVRGKDGSRVRESVSARSSPSSSSVVVPPCRMSDSLPSAAVSRSVRVRSSTPSASSAPATSPDEAPPPPKKKASRPRIDALDSLRFFLIMYISTGHFVAFATGNTFVQAFFSQVNVVVGAFFVLSGYVAGYTSTELGKYEASPRVSPAVNYSIQRIMGFFPLYMLGQILFLPMFAYVDVLYNGVVKTFAHFLTTATLTQAWFPLHAELWNAPSWFLSALAFSLLALPYTLPSIAGMKKKGLRRAFAVLTAVSLIAKIAYSYDLNVWTAMEGMMRKHPNLVFWNNTRFNPFYAFVEVLMGVCASRLVMLDGVDGEISSTAATGKWFTKPATLLVGMLAMLTLRAAGILTLNDALARGIIFIPLWSLFMMQIHRETVKGIGADDSEEEQPSGLTGALKSKPLVWLGSIAFPIYIFHGPLGQLFYKKAIATKVFGAVMSKKFGYSFFYVYMASVIGVSVLVKKFFLDSKAVQTKTKELTGSLCKLVE